MDKYHLRNAQGQYLCYNEGFYYEWVNSARIQSGHCEGLVSFVGRHYAELKIREASTPKRQANMVRPDYPDMTGAWAAAAL